MFVCFITKFAIYLPGLFVCMYVRNPVLVIKSRKTFLTHSHISCISALLIMAVLFVSVSMVLIKRLFVTI